MEDKQNLEDMFSALLSTRRMMVNRTGTFEGMGDAALETITWASNAEINMLAWVLGYGQPNQDFLTCSVCEACGGRGWTYADIDNECVQVPCSCSAPAREGSN